MATWYCYPAASVFEVFSVYFYNQGVTTQSCEKKYQKDRIPTCLVVTYAIEKFVTWMHRKKQNLTSFSLQAIARFAHAQEQTSFQRRPLI